MNRPRSRWSTCLTVLVTAVVLVLLALVVLMAPLGIQEASQRWFFHKNRNNPKCDLDLDCVSYALESCEAPKYVVRCRRKDSTYQDKGVCICGLEGLTVGRLLEEMDAGVDASH